MTLPLTPPIAPMLAKLVRSFPEAGDFIFEPKWDGFRAIIFRDGKELFIQSRDERPLDRYFPELREPILAALPERCVLDGELVIAGPAGLDFGALQLRLHPARSRVEKLAQETPASFVAFDVLALGDESLLEVPFVERRERLEALLTAVPSEREAGASKGGPRAQIHLTPATRDPALARDWFARFEGAGLDGVVAKPTDLLYQPNKRVMLKLKHQRTVDCVVAGFRTHKAGKDSLIGSLLLGLFDAEGVLHHVGVTSSFTMERRRALYEELAPLRERALDGHPWADWAEAVGAARRPGMASRWSRDKDLSWEPLRVERVAEVSYDGLQAGRFRHAATFVRWRPDKPPKDCTFDQLEVSPPYELARIFGAQDHSDAGS